MDLLKTEWTNLASIYSRRVGMAFYQMKVPFVELFPPQVDNQLCPRLKEIERMARVHNGGAEFTAKVKLMQQLLGSSSEPELLRKLKDKIMEKCLSEILQHHLGGLKEMKCLNRKISKRLEILRSKTAHAGSIRDYLIGLLRKQMKTLRYLVEHHSLVLACLDLKLRQHCHIHSKTKRTLLYKIVKSTWKLLKSFPPKSTKDGETESESKRNKWQAIWHHPKVKVIEVQPYNPRAFLDNQADRLKQSSICIGDGQGQSGTRNNMSHGRVRLINVQPCNAETSWYKPADIGQPSQSRGRIPKSQVEPKGAAEYAQEISRDNICDIQYMIPDPTPRTPNPHEGPIPPPSPLQDPSSRQVKSPQEDPISYPDPSRYQNYAPNQTSYPRYNPILHKSYRLVDDVTLPNVPIHEKPAACPGKMAPTAAWGDTDRNTLAKSSGVYVRATTTYKAQDKTQISVKVGQKVKQKMEANSDGLAYGWTRAHRLAPKHYGYHPVSCVQLLPDKTR